LNTNAEGGSLVASDGATVNISSADSGLAAAALAAAENIAAQNALVTGAVASTGINVSGAIANNAINQGANLAGQALGVVVNGQTLQQSLANTTADVLLANNATTARALTSANDNATDVLRAISREQTNTFSELLSSSNRNAAAAAAVASNATDAAVASANRATAGALGFGADSLAAVNTANRSAYGFAGDALAASLVSSGRAVTAAGDALDSSLSFTQRTNTAALDFLDNAFGDVLGLVKETAKSTQNEAAATRDFASSFVGDFYESQKSGDVQTIQQITKVIGVAAVAFALAWALRAKSANA